MFRRPGPSWFVPGRVLLLFLAAAGGGGRPSARVCSGEIRTVVHRLNSSTLRHLQEVLTHQQWQCICLHLQRSEYWSDERPLRFMRWFTYFPFEAACHHVQESEDSSPPCRTMLNHCFCGVGRGGVPQLMVNSAPGWRGEYCLDRTASDNMWIAQRANRQISMRCFLCRKCIRAQEPHNTHPLITRKQRTRDISLSWMVRLDW